MLCYTSHPAAPGSILAFPDYVQKSMLPRFIDSALLREWTVQSLMVDQTHLLLVSGKLVLQVRVLPVWLQGRDGRSEARCKLWWSWPPGRGCAETRRGRWSSQPGRPRSASGSTWNFYSMNENQKYPTTLQSLVRVVVRPDIWFEKPINRLFFTILLW